MNKEHAQQLAAARSTLAVASPALLQIACLEAAIVRHDRAIDHHQSALNGMLRKQAARKAEYERQCALHR